MKYLEKLMTMDVALIIIICLILIVMLLITGTIRKWKLSHKNIDNENLSEKPVSPNFIKKSN